jgi:hypothetical protein
LLLLIKNKENKFFGILVLIYWVKVCNKILVLGSAMALLFKVDFFMIHLWVIKEYLKMIMKKYKNKLKSIHNKSNHIKEYF